MMTSDQTPAQTLVTAETIKSALLSFLEGKTKTAVAADQDLFASGLVSSMFAMELVVHLEERYHISIVGPDLKLDNFRTVHSMAELVLRLRAELNADGNG
jgi:methoxymalonate biosynthesis acyl carrier protein